MNNDDILPTLSKTEESNLCTFADNGTPIYAHNVKKHYTPEEREKLIEGFYNYFVSFTNPSWKQEAYADLMWHLFPDSLSQERKMILN